MNAKKKFFYNTLSLYCKIIINTLISIYLTRIVLGALGVNDFGLFNLVAGTIAFLSFINSALLTSSQRFLSVCKGKNDLNQLKSFYSSSIVIHIALAFILFVLFEIAFLFLFDGFFNIVQDKIGEAKKVYQITCFSMIITVIGVPFNSVINANEDLIFFSVVESFASILKLGIIILFQIFPNDALITYTAWLAFITLISTLIKYAWCKIKYEECRNIDFHIERKSIIDMISFSGWNCLGSFAMVCRSQGVAFVINNFWGTAINAVYGISNQVNGQLSYFSQMLTASFAPQIMKSAGDGNFERMKMLAVFSSKAAFFMSAIFAIPLLVKMSYVLDIWLKDVPNLTLEFCNLTIFVFLIMQLYPGLVRAIQAVGKIKNYQIIVSVLLVLPIIIGILLYRAGFNPYSICYAMIAIQLLVLIVTIYYSKILYGLNSAEYYLFIAKAIMGFFIIIFGLKLIDESLNNKIGDFFSLLIIGLLSILLLGVYFICFIFTKDETIKLFNLFKK